MNPNNMFFYNNASGMNGIPGVAGMMPDLNAFF